MKKLFFAAGTLLFVACLFGSSQLLTPEASVATVNGRAITVAAFDSTYEQVQRDSDPQTPVDSLRKAALDSLIAHELIGIRLDSIRESLNNDWDFCQKRQGDVDQALFQVVFEKQIVANVKIDSGEVEQYFNSHREKYYDPEQVKARHILIRRPNPDTAGVKSERKRKKLLDDSDKFARKRADAVMKKALAGDNWDSLATAYSEDKNNATKGGDLGYFTHGRMMAEFDSVAFKAKPGTIVGPVSTKFGYHIIKVEDHKQAQPKELDDDIRKNIETTLNNEHQKDKATAFMDSLKIRATYQFNEEKLAMPDSLVDPKTWIMVVDSTDTLYQTTVRESLPKYKRWKQLDTVTVADKKDMLNMLTTSLLLRRAGRDLGYAQDPSVLQTYNEATNSEATVRLSAYLRDLSYEPSEEEIANYFNTHAEDYKEKSPLLVHHIIFQDSAFAEVIRDSILAGADFTEMAKKYYPGDPEIREVAYNLDYIGPKDMGAEFYQVAETLKVGDISHPVKTKWGYHIIKMVNKKQDRTLAQVRPGIRQKMKETRDAQKTAMLVAEWRQNAIIKVNEKLLKQIPSSEKKVIHVESTGPKQKAN